MQLDVIDRPPPEYLALVWDEFCASRGRGVSIAAHFSWMLRPDAFSIVLSVDGVIVGGLAVGPLVRSGFTAGRVGAVVVAAAHRGQGYSAVLMEAAKTESRRRGFDDLILWTGTPAVYERAGFRIRDEGLFGQVTGPGHAKAGPVPSKRAWPTPGDLRDLPLFATEACVLENDRASVVVLTARHQIVAEWAGDVEAVLALMAASLGPDFPMNARQGDSLLDAMADAGWMMALEPSRLEMFCPLSDQSPVSDPYGLRVLDRV